MIVFILLTGLVIRLIKLDQSLWLDEAININAISNLSFRDLVLTYSLGDFHPPLFHVLLKTWAYFLPYSEIAFRFLSVLLGVGTIFVIYKLAKKLYEEKTALIASILLATAPLHVYYSQEARMYMLATFFATLSVYFFTSILKKDNILSWIGFIVSTTLMLYSDYLPYLLLPTYIAYLLIFRNKIKKNTLISFIPALLLIIIFLIPWLLVLPKQLQTGLSAAAASPAWANVVGSSDLKNLFITFVKFTIGRISSDNNLVYALLFLPAGIFVILMFILSLFRLSNIRSFLWFWFFIPLSLTFIISFFIPIFSYFRLIFILPAFYLIWASAITSANIPKLFKLLFICAITINTMSLFIYFLNPKFQRENWKDATSYVQDHSAENSIVLFESSSSFAPFDYYNQNKVEAQGALSGFEANRQDVQKTLRTLSEGKNQLFLFQYLSGITDPAGILFEEITNLGFKNTKTKDFSGVGFVYEFSR